MHALLAAQLYKISTVVMWPLEVTVFNSTIKSLQAYIKKKGGGNKIITKKCIKEGHLLTINRHND